jgi:hypothetical protein
MGDNKARQKKNPAISDNSFVSFEPKNIEELQRFFKAEKNRYHEIWVVLTKKAHANPQPVSFTEAVAEAVKQGLIDSRTKTLNAEKYAIRFTKRKIR